MRFDFAAWWHSLPPSWREDSAIAVAAKARAAYDTAGRHYHTWTHILDCVEKLRGFPAGNPRNAFLALLFHDAIYVVGAKDNEDRSAQLAREILESHSSVAAADIAAIERYILATKSHTVDPAETSEDLKAVVDIDMSILGADPEAYDRYAENVRREWVPAVVSDEGFRGGRTAFLQGVLQGPIFSTPEGIRRWDAAARTNIARELGTLSPALPQGGGSPSTSA